eukprot:RCo044848
MTPRNRFFALVQSLGLVVLGSLFLGFSSATLARGEVRDPTTGRAFLGLAIASLVLSSCATALQLLTWGADPTRRNSNSPRLPLSPKMTVVSAARGAAYQLLPVPPSIAVALALALVVASAVCGAIYCSLAYTGRFSFEVMLVIPAVSAALVYPQALGPGLSLVFAATLALRVAVGFSTPGMGLVLASGQALAVDLVLALIGLIQVGFLLYLEQTMKGHLTQLGKVVNQLAVTVTQCENPGTIVRELVHKAMVMLPRGSSNTSLVSPTVDPTISEVRVPSLREGPYARKEVSVLCITLVFFDKLLQDLGHPIATDAVKQFWGEVSRTVLLHGGFLERISPSTAFASFNAESEVVNHEFAACRCALKISETAVKPTEVPLQAAFGVASGEVLTGVLTQSSGRVISESIFEASNMVARLNVQLGTTVLFTESVWTAVGNRLHCRAVDVLRGLWGTVESTTIYEAIGTGVTPPFLKQYAVAFAQFRDAKLAEAMLTLQDYLSAVRKSAKRGDSCAERLLSVCRECAQDPFEAPYFRRIFVPSWTIFRGEALTSSLAFGLHPSSSPREWAGTVDPRRMTTYCGNLLAPTPSLLGTLNNAAPVSGGRSRGGRASPTHTPRPGEEPQRSDSLTRRRPSLTNMILDPNSPLYNAPIPHVASEVIQRAGSAHGSD